MIRADSFKDQKVAVFGLGRSGMSAARALAAGGARLCVWDDNAPRRTDAAANGIELAELMSCDWTGIRALILSPGVPLTHPEPHPVVMRARAAGAEVIGDVELFLRNRDGGRLVGITGTNGKSTTTALVGHILQAAGRKAETGGNLGKPVLEFSPKGEAGVEVVEMSSYQIDLSPSWQADVAVLLNITPDHLDRHGDMDGYVAVKKRIFANQTEDQVAVIGVDDAHCAKIADVLEAAGRQRLVRISAQGEVAGGVHAADGRLVDATGGSAVLICDLAEAPALKGRHNWQNAAAAAAAALALGLTHDEIRAGLLSFPGLAHRMERVGEVDGLLFVNDSKATNADAAAKALDAYEDIYWIAGGRAKAGGIASLESYFGHIRHAFLIGEAAEEFAATLEGKVAFTLSGTLEQAVVAAHAMAVAEDHARQDGQGGVVLLSPACASFDQFPSFEARGEAFRHTVEALASACASGGPSQDHEDKDVEGKKGPASAKEVMA